MGNAECMNGRSAIGSIFIKPQPTRPYYGQRVPVYPDAFREAAQSCPSGSLSVG